MNRQQLIIWLSGLFEGEGTFRFTNNIGTSISITSTDKDVIERIHINFGGFISTPNKGKEHWKQPYIWGATGNNAKNIVEAIRPFLLSRRAFRAKQWLDSFEENFRIQQNKISIRKIKNIEILRLRNKGLKHREIAEIVNLDRTTVSKFLKKHGV